MRHEVKFSDRSTVIYQSDITQSSITIRHAFVLRAPPRHTTLWPGEYLDLDITVAGDFPGDQSYIVEPCYDSKQPQSWIQPHVITSVGHTLRIPNATDSPVILRKHDHFCQVRPVYVAPHDPLCETDTPPIPNTKNKYSAGYLKVAIDPDNILQANERRIFEEINHEFSEVFLTQGKVYNGHSGPINAVVNMGPVQPPQHKGKLPLYGRRKIASWQYIIQTDLKSAFYHIPLFKDSIKYCGVATLFRGAFVYTHAARWGFLGRRSPLRKSCVV